MKRNNKLWPFIAMAVFIALFSIAFRPILADADQKVLSLGGDGCKNIFTYLYHALYGQGLWFEGMNYPFGEHVVFTDNQPAVSVPLATLNRWLGLSPGGLLATMYYLIALSFVVGAQYTYRLLVRYGAHPLFAIAVAGLVMLLSPQVHRYDGHFPLAYSAFVPMLFFWTVRYHEGGGWRYGLKLALLLFVFAFVHMYFLAMGALWMVCYAGAYWLVARRPALQKAAHTGLYLAMLALAYVGVQGLFRVTDPVTDRPVYPLGSVVGAPLWEISNSSRSPVWQFLKEQNIESNLKDPGDGGAYFGMAAMGMILAGTGFWIYRLARRRKETIPATMPPIWLLMAAGITIFSLTVVEFWDVGILKPLLKPMRQFRSPQRFTWIGYYVFSVYAGLLLWRILTTWRRGRGAVPAMLLAGITAVLWIIEGIGNVGWMQEKKEDWAAHSKFFFSTGEKSWGDFLKERQLGPDSFSAILTLPYVHSGSEKLAARGEHVWSMTLAYTAAIQLHLPIMDVNMSRTSWQQTFAQVKIDGGIFAQQPVLEKIQDERPLLLLHFKDYPVLPDEASIYAVADSIGFYKDCGVYVFSPKAYLARRRQVGDSLRALAAAQIPADAVYNSTLPVYLNHYESMKAPHRFAGAGAAPAATTDDAPVLEWTLPAPADSQLYEFSAWARFPEQGYTTNYYAIRCRDGQGRELQVSDALGTHSVDNAPGLWFRVHKYFTVPAGTRSIAVRVFNGPKGYEAMDELLIRPAAATVISKLPDGTVLVNNHVLESPGKQTP